MIAIRIVCAWDSLDRAHEMERRLGAEGHVVSVACGLAALDDLENRSDARECLVCLWSEYAIDSSFVWQWIDATDPAMIVELRLGDSAPHMKNRHEEPIDFTRWRGDRGNACWKEFEQRIRRVSAGEIGGPRIEPVRAAIAFSMLAALVTGAAVGVRMFDAPDTQTAAASTTPTAPVLPTDPATNHMGGLDASLPYVEPADADDLEPFHRGRLIRARALPASPGADLTLADANLRAPMTFRDRSLLDGLLSPFRSERE